MRTGLLVKLKPQSPAAPSRGPSGLFKKRNKWLFSLCPPLQYFQVPWFNHLPASCLKAFRARCGHLYHQKAVGTCETSVCPSLPKPKQAQTHASDHPAMGTSLNPRPLFDRNLPLKGRYILMKIFIFLFFSLKLMKENAINLLLTTAF